MRIAPSFLVLLTFTQACGDGGGAPDGGGRPNPDGAVVLDDAGNPVLDDAGNPIPVPDAPPQLIVITACATGGDHATIQAAIDAAPEGARVEICAGTYEENVFLGKALSLAGAGAVIIDGRAGGPALTVHGVTTAPARLTNLTLTNGRGGALGGGGLRVDQSVLDAGALTIEANSAARGGGVAILGGDVHLHDSTIRANHAGDRGGGVYLAADARLTAVTIDANSSDGKGGGFYIDGFAPVVTGSTISANTSGGDGAGGQAYLTHATLEHNVFIANQSADDAGGLRVHLSQAVIRNNEFRANVAAGGGDGGGIKASHERSEITDNLFQGNTAGGAGGGLEVDDDQSLVARNVFRENRALRGGGIHAALLGSPATFEDNVLDGNVAELRGGGVFLQNSLAAVTLINHTFVNNVAERGASFAATAAPFVVTNSVMTGGGGATSGSAVYISSGASGTLAFLVAVDNDASAPAFRIVESTVTVHSSILQGDVRVDGAPPVWRYNDVYPAAVWEGMADPTGADGNLSVDPLFAGEYRLSPASPLIDAGDPGFTDLDGTPADMGLYGGPDAP